MKYITQDDLKTVIQNRLLLESIENDLPTLDEIESLVLSEVAAYIGLRYDTGKIFADTPLRTGLLVRVVVCLTVARAVRRNAARKVPDSITDLEDWAYAILEKLRDGLMGLPSDMPPVTGEDGKPEEPLIYGHTKNNDWFI